MSTFQQIVLASRPEGSVVPANFRLETVAVPELRDGEILVRNHYLSLDPYMRGRMSDAKSYAAPQALGSVMIGGTVGEVAASKNPRFVAGDLVSGMLGWSEMAVSDGVGLTKRENKQIPLSAYLGAVGMPGMTAWQGLNLIMHPKAGETVVISAASGAVGGIVGQLAKLRGCRVVGIAGGPEKCAYVVDELGFDACVDYKAGALADDLTAATPDGIDALFENVGGEVFDSSLARMNPFGRVAICGLISGYSGHMEPLKNVRVFLTMRLTVQGFINGENVDLSEGVKELTQLVADGKLKYRESIAQGLAAAPEAFIGLLKGKNFGKQLVKLI